MPEIIFQQDGTPAHTAKLTQEWCENNFPHFWRKEEWPGNSPDLNPIENLWAIVKGKVDEMRQPSDIDTLVKILKKAWSQIDPDILTNLVADMPNRIKFVIERDGDYIDK